MKTKIAIAIGLVLIVIVIAAFVDSLPYSKSKQPNIDTNGLIPIRVEVPVQSNGFSLLIQAGQALALSDDDAAFAGSTNWDDARARDILETNATAIALMHKAWSCPSLQVDTITNAEQEFPYLHEWRGLAQLAALETRSSFEHRDDQRGFNQAMELVRFGQRIQGADGPYIHYLTGYAVKDLGLKCIRQFVGETALSATNLILISDQLTNFEADQDGLRQTLKIEYATNAKRLDDVTSMAATNSSFYFNFFIYDADKSKLELASQIFATMRALTNYYAKGVGLIPVVNTNASFVKRLLHGNMMGSILNDMSLDTRSRMLAVKCRENVSVRATRVIIALKAFQIVNHKPPGSLNELTPAFLEAVPLDDFDGNPIRYSLNQKEVYSVGTGLVDWGGMKSTNSPNLLYPVNF